MFVDLEKVFDRGEKEKVIEAQFDFKDDDFGKLVRFLEPVNATLCLKKGRGELYVSLQGRREGRCVCERCLDEFTRTFPFSREYIFTPRDLQDDDIEIPLRQNILDFRQFVFSELYLGLPTVILCSDDCQGLCPVCGRPLKEGCDCARKASPDPRFSVLKELLDEDE